MYTYTVHAYYKYIYIYQCHHHHHVPLGWCRNISLSLPPSCCASKHQSRSSTPSRQELPGFKTRPMSRLKVVVVRSEETLSNLSWGKNNAQNPQKLQKWNRLSPTCHVVLERSLKMGEMQTGTALRSCCSLTSAPQRKATFGSRWDLTILTNKFSEWFANLKNVMIRKFG